MAKEYFSDYIQPPKGKYDHKKFLVLNSVLYRQGWFFTHSLFKVKYSTFYAFDKESSKKLLKRLIKLSDERGIEAYNTFMEKINTYSDNDHFILEISW